ncbi:MAG TPA: GlsB/YeaQ/YmgE family stress response membrane protein [Dehalococcoidia bacterium]|jgi:uncharacterized membrane protein YeaQ/YmgE (transglycosylase-associated protein family)|nr:GlsB/YeaQ/YmgE family stress response membrane protein [Dehalococcoidia bacterium]
MSIIAWIVVGLIAGVIAKMLMPGKEPGGGIILTILLGIGGAIVGGFLAVALGISDGVNNFDVGTIVLAVAGAMLLLFAYRAVSGGGLRV